MKIKKIFIYLFLIIFLFNIYGKEPAGKIILNKGVKTTEFLTELEIEVMKELNLARGNPKYYAELLTEFKQYYNGTYLKIPGEITLVTNEGIRAVNEAIIFLNSQASLNPLKLSKGLSFAARDQVKYQGPKGLTGHSGQNGSSPFDRMNQYGSWMYTAGENIDYGNNIARRIVFALIIDDRVSSRGHRKNIFSEKFNTVGIACGTHAKYRHMCVMDFAGEYKEK